MKNTTNTWKKTLKKKKKTNNKAVSKRDFPRKGTEC